jgi:transporter family-2 protein
MGGGFEPVDKSSSPPATKLQLAMYSSLVVAIGLIGAVQTVVNNRAGEHFNSFLIGSWIEFAGGALCILFCVGFEMAWEKRGSFLRMKRCLHWRDIVPGCISMVFVCAMVGLTTVTGFSLFFIGAVVGQLLASATFDQFGLCGGLKMPLKPQQFVAITFAVIGAVLSAVDTLINTKSEFSPGIVGACTACAIGAGTLLPLQAAMNRQLSDALPSKMQATLFSFTVGLVSIYGAAH